MRALSVRKFNQELVSTGFAVEDLPFKGSSHDFVRAEYGDTQVSVFFFNGQPGAGPDRIAIR